MFGLDGNARAGAQIAAMTELAAGRAALSLSFLGALSDDLQERLFRSTTVLDVPAGRSLFDPDLAIVVNGTLRAFVTDASGRQLTVRYVRTPDALGLAPAHGREFPVGYQAVTDCRLLRFGRSTLDELRGHPELGWASAELLAYFLDEVLAETARVAFHSVRERVAYHLVAAAGVIAGQPLPVHQSDLAAAVGSVREVVARALGQLHHAGLIDVTAAGIVVLDAAGLKAVAEARN
jgi:CRP/FNR family cyclic AMP-dependent transcriptional regulator